MKRIFISSVQKEFERERAAIKRMIETDPIIKPHFRIVIWRKENGNKLEITSAKLIELIEKNGKASLIEYAEACGCDNKMIKRAIESLKKAKMVRHVGSKKYGYWEVVPLVERGR